MEFLLWLLALIYVYIFLIYAPSIRIRQAKWFKRHYAHRGLFDEKRVENSLEAFKAAIDAGHGIELDVQCTLDGEVVVFHDASLKRLCSNPAVVGDTPYQTLQSFRLLNSSSKIPTLSETLDLVSSQVPLIIEIKHSYQRKKVVKKILEVLKPYPGPFSICSFDPFIVRQVRKQNKKILRGQLIESYKSSTTIKGFSRIMLEYAFLNLITRPDYISIRYDYSNLSYRVHRLLGGYGVMWPITNQNDEDKIKTKCDVIIFEQYRPVTDTSLVNQANSVE